MAVDESRLMEGVHARAERLFDDGYTAEAADKTTVIVKTPAGAMYAIDTRLKTCTCPFFVKWEGKFCCKHLLGYSALLLRQAAYERLTITRYKQFFALWDEAGELVAVTVYRVGAESVRKRLSALALSQQPCACQQARHRREAACSP